MFPRRINANAAFAAGLTLWLTLAVTYSIYAQGLPTGLLFDDLPNLKGLDQVDSAEAAWAFITNGQAGPLGRPVALATFLLNIPHWPSEPQALARINVLLHLLNGALLAWLAFRLLTLQGKHPNPNWTALSAATVWLLLPILASSSLMIIQRMTVLSGTFVLSGLLLYVIGLSKQAQGNRLAAGTLQISGITGGTLLAALTKENGALLPLLALTIEATLLHRAAGISTTRRLRLRLLGVPALAVLVFILVYGFTSDYSHRSFSLSERVASQTIVLWDYLRLSFLPRPNAFSPFHDGYLLEQRAWPSLWLPAALAWSVIVFLAARKRTAWPLYSFAVFWFLAAHAMEATVIPLEPFFEHRNYVPLMGVSIAMTWAIANRFAKSSITWVAASAYTLTLAATLWGTTSLWGSRELAAEVWANNHPHSERAAQFLAKRELKLGDRRSAERVLTEAFSRSPSQISLGLQSVLISCQMKPDTARNDRWRTLIEATPTGDYSRIFSQTVEELVAEIIGSNCGYIGLSEALALAEATLKNPKYSRPADISRLHGAIARVYHEWGDITTAITHLNKAFDASPHIDTATLTVYVMIQAGRYSDATAFLKKAKTVKPTSASETGKWDAVIRALMENLTRDPN